MISTTYRFVRIDYSNEGSHVREGLAAFSIKFGVLSSFHPYKPTSQTMIKEQKLLQILSGDGIDCRSGSLTYSFET